MASQIKKIIVNENGVTLVEVIASFVLLIIILFSFFTLFIQTAKTTKSSERIVDATYVAQTEMEKLYEEGTLTRNIIVKNLNFIPESTSTTTFQKTTNNYLVILKLKPNKDSELKNVVLEVTKRNKIKAIMETVVQWGGPT